MKKSKKKLSGKQLTKALDQVIRDILKIEAGANPQCFVCGKHLAWFHPQECPYGLQVGHFVSRRVYPLRWDLKNVFPQCSADNYTHQHNQLPFTARIIEEFGPQRIEYLNNKYQEYKKRGKTLTRLEKEALLNKLQDYLDGLSNSSR
jgi:hypothetical protein